ncbi:MAG TPA: GIY-YIG nuclease family protein [Ohtaekwangia sp.]
MMHQIVFLLLYLLKMKPLSSNHSAWVYILTNRYNTTLYTGITTDLSTRLWEHRTKSDPKSFTARYNLYKLVYFEGFDTIVEAVAYEKFIKGKTRNWKESLIQKLNPEWNDLSDVTYTL